MAWFRKSKTPPTENGGGDKSQNVFARVMLALLKFVFVTVILGVLRSVARVVMWLLALSATVTTALALSFVFAPELIKEIDAWKPEFFDTQLDIKRSQIERLRDPSYFAEQSAIVTDDDKSVACISSPVRRILLADAEDIPPLFMKAIVASEDKRFFEHSGVDMEGIGRAVWKQFVLGTSTSGASTLTMQMAKDLRLGTGRRTTTKEKIGDIVTALRIELEFSKHQLLLKYVNMPYFGRGQYGIEAASRSYFGKPARELKLHQVGFIVALISKPGLPFREYASDRGLKTTESIRDANWQEMLRITRRVLERMLEEGEITDAQYATAANAIDKSLRKELLARGASCGANDYFLEQVRVNYKDKFPINKGGLTISITRDDGLQNVLERAVKMTLGTYLARHQSDLDNDQLRAGAFAIDFSGEVLAEVGNIDFKKFKYDVMTQGWRSPGSTIKPFTYASLVQKLVEEVMAEPNPPDTLDATVARVLAKCNLLDAPIGVSLGRGRGVKMIQNFHSRSQPLYRGNISCQLALGESRNAAAMRAGQKGGIKEMINLIYLLGMPKDGRYVQQPYPTTAIGGSDVRPIGMSGVATFLNGGFRVTPRFTNDVCKDGSSLLYIEDDGLPRQCDHKGERRQAPERLIGPVLAATMIELMKGPIDLPTGSAHSLRTGVIPGMDPLSSDIWKMKKEEKEKRTLAFPIGTSGEIAGKTGTATNADGRTSDVWLMLFVPGPEAHPEKGIMLVFWMGKDSKDHALGERGTTGGGGFAESGGRNWTHSAATVLAFLQKERGYLKAGNKFRPIVEDQALVNFGVRPVDSLLPEAPLDPDVRIVDPSDPETPEELLKLVPPPTVEDVVEPLATPAKGEGDGPVNAPSD